MKALDKSADSPTSDGRVDWFAFLSSVNGGLRISPDVPLGIGADSELCFSFEDAKHAVTFSREGNQLFVTPKIGGVTIDGKDIHGRAPVAPNTTLLLGRTPMFIATSPILDRMPPILLRERFEPKRSENATDKQQATNVFQLPSRANVNDGLGEIIVPAGIPAAVQPDLKSADWAVVTKTPQTLKIRVWRMALLLCLTGAVLFPWLKQYIPDLNETFSIPEATQPKVDAKSPAMSAESVSPRVVDAKRLDPEKSEPELEVAKPEVAKRTESEALAEVKGAQEAKKVQEVKTAGTGRNNIRIVVPDPIETVSLPEKLPSFVAQPEPVAQPPVVTRPQPVTTPEKTPAGVSKLAKAEKQQPELPLPAESLPLGSLPSEPIGAPQNTAYKAIERVDTEHLLAAAQWAMRSGDGPGALILLEAIITKVPDHPQALALRDQLRRIMTEVELK